MIIRNREDLATIKENAEVQPVTVVFHSAK